MGLIKNIKDTFKYNNLGLSMIEIMVAFSILVVSFVGIVQSFPFGLSIGSEGEMTTVSSYLCQEKIEELISLGYSGISTGLVEAKHRLSEEDDNYLHYYQRQTEVDYVDGNLDDSVADLGIKKISATVYYINPISKKEKEYNITTLISTR